MHHISCGSYSSAWQLESNSGHRVPFSSADLHENNRGQRPITPPHAACYETGGQNNNPPDQSHVLRPLTEAERTEPRPRTSPTSPPTLTPSRREAITFRATSPGVICIVILCKRGAFACNVRARTCNSCIKNLCRDALCDAAAPSCLRTGLPVRVRTAHVWFHACARQQTDGEKDAKKK